jgi:outer membrane protein TolC
MKKLLRAFVAPLFVAALYIPTAMADERCALPLSFEEFRAYAFSKSSLIAEIDRDYALEVAKAIDTKLWANPELSVEQVYTRMKLNGDSDPQINAYLSQPIKLSNFGKRDRVASLIRRAGDVKKRAKLLELSQKLLLQYTALYSFQETDKILGAAEEMSAARVTALDKGVKEGLISEGAHSLFIGERFRLKAQREGLTASLEALRGEISTLIGSSCRVVASARPPSPPVPGLDDLRKRAQESELSESSRVDLLEALASEQSALADLDAVPSLIPRFVYQHTNDGGDFVGAGVSIPLPLWNRNQAESTRADAEHRAIMAKKAFLHDGGLASTVTSLRLAASSSQRQVEIYRTKVVPSFELAFKAEERLYKEGKGSLLDLWQTFRAMNEARLNELTLQTEAIRHRAELSVLVGEEI